MTTRELERRDAGTPVEFAVGLQVLVGIPKRTVIGGIYRHGAIIPPPAQTSCLRSRAFLNTCFNCQDARGISRSATGVANTGVEVVTGDTIAEREIAHLVHGDTAHPAVGRVRRISSLLSKNWDPVRHGLAGRNDEFVPARGRDHI